MAEKPTPLYVRAANDLRAKIHDGTYPPSTPLPGADELRARYQIGSYGTLSKVYKILTTEGLIRRNAAVGMIVQDPTPPVVDLVLHNPTGHGPLPWSQCCDRAGVEGEMVTNDVDPHRAEEDLAALLGIDTGAAVVVRHRTATIDGHPVRLDEAIYSRDLVDGTPITTERQTPGGIYATLAQAGHAPAEVTRRTVGARLATTEEAKQLKLTAGAWVLTADLVIADRRGQAVEVLRIVANPARVRFVDERMPL